MKTLGFIFDLDGTILDTTHYYRKAWEDLIREFDAPYDADELLKHSARDGIRKMLGEDFPSDQLEQQVARQAGMGLARMRTEGVAAHDGIPELIAALHACGVRLAIATLAEPENTTFPLGLLGLADYFDAIVTDADVSRSKPFPDVYLKALERLDMSAENCAAMEDAPNGVLAAKAAGLKVIAVETTHSRWSLEQAGADRVVNRADELTADEVIRFITRQ